jgi:glycosyltransferase involved in cell wall biosynthesis
VASRLSSTSRPAAWHIITAEYPPQPGGVSDYVRQVARALAGLGHEVHVWAPPVNGPLLDGDSVAVHRLPARFSPAALRALRKGLDASPGPRRILVQWVPGAFGLNGMNILFPLSIALRRVDRVWIMYHEYAYPLGWRLKPAHNLLGLVTPITSGILAWRADRIFVSTPSWIRRIPKLLRAPARRPITCLPIPSNVSSVHDPARAAEIRSRLLSGGSRWLLGHFGTYGPAISDMLRAIAPALLARGDRTLLLLGRGSDRFAADLLREKPHLSASLVAPGGLPEPELANHLRACDLLVQPYEDGVTSRRGTLMAGLALGLPVVTNSGPLAEASFAQEGAVRMAPDPDPESIVAAVEEVLGDAALRAAIATRGRAFYESRFSLQHTLAVLRETAGREDA